MKVKKLIEKLNKLDPHLQVYCFPYEGGCHGSVEVVDTRTTDGVLLLDAPVPGEDDAVVSDVSTGGTSVCVYSPCVYQPTIKQETEDNQPKQDKTRTFEVGSFRSNGESPCSFNNGSVYVTATMPRGLWAVVMVQKE